MSIVNFTVALLSYRFPLLRNPAQRRFLVELRGLLARWSELAVRGDASGEEVVHQAGLDLLRLGDERFGLLDGLVDRREDRGDALLIWKTADRAGWPTRSVSVDSRSRPTAVTAPLPGASTSSLEVDEYKRRTSARQDCA